ncbi:YtxH domain-containing protein [Ferruginibacter sp.]
MKSKKIIAGAIVGTVVALMLIPKTRKMLAEAINNLAGTLKKTLENANTLAGDLAETGKNEMNKISGKAYDTVAGTAKTAKDVWQS